MKCLVKCCTATSEKEEGGRFIWIGVKGGKKSRDPELKWICLPCYEALTTNKYCPNSQLHKNILFHEAHKREQK